MPQKQKTWSQLKLAGNESFKKGQYGEATAQYSRAIQELEKCRGQSPDDLAVLYSNRAASLLKDGNCSECVKDCNTSLELSPFNVKSLLRRAAAFEALERYRQAYVDYKTALQIDCNIAAAQDGTNRMSRALAEADGPSWRAKLPPVPTVPLAVKERLCQQQQLPPGPSKEQVKKAAALKEEGNALVKQRHHGAALEKYSLSLELNPAEVTTYTNRALCFLALQQLQDAVRDCDTALELDAGNVKALYRRAQAHAGLKDTDACVKDLRSLLQVEPSNSAALKLLQEVQK